MSYSVFVNYAGPHDASETLARAFAAGPQTLLTGAPLAFFATYQPADGEVVQFRDGPGAPLLLEFNLSQRADAAEFLQSAAFETLIQPSGWAGLSEVDVTVDVFETVHYPLTDGRTPRNRQAPLSFVVRYYRPVADELAFADFYARNHPPLLAQFPGIRNVLCYLPVDINLPDGAVSSGAFLGNEVVFDDLASLKAALASDVLEALKADGRRFAPFGHNTHHAMLRRDFHG